MVEKLSIGYAWYWSTEFRGDNMKTRPESTCRMFMTFLDELFKEMDE